MFLCVVSGVHTAVVYILAGKASRYSGKGCYVDLFSYREGGKLLCANIIGAITAAAVSSAFVCSIKTQPRYGNPTHKLHISTVPLERYTKVYGS